MKVQVVIGANYGDEGKGLVSGCLAREARKNNEKILTVFYNGTTQRAHTFEGFAHRGLGAGTIYGSDTFYHRQFVVDPIALFIMQIRPVVDPECRIILPCDVIKNRKLETERGAARHGSCGSGLFEAVKRSKDREYCILARDLRDEWTLYQKLRKIMNKYGSFDDELYNIDYFMKAVAAFNANNGIKPFELAVRGYDRIIFEGGQGLLLGQENMGDYPHLTPSSPGNTFIAEDIKKLGVAPELFYVSRSYMTRHGAGPMECECSKDELNNGIIDNTNLTNQFQGSLRFGRMNVDTLTARINKDASLYDNAVKNVVFTQLNYTNGKLDTVDGLKSTWAAAAKIGADNLYLSDQRDEMEMVK